MENKEDLRQASKNSKKGIKDPLMEVIEAAKKHPWSNTVTSLVFWKDIVRSAMVFAIGNLTFFLLQFCNYTVISLLSSVFFMLLLISILYVQYEKIVKNNPNPLHAKFENVDFAIKKETMEQTVEVLTKGVELLFASFKDAIFQRERSLHTGLALVGLKFLGDLFSGATLLHLAFLWVFIWPSLYQQKHSEIDRLVVNVYKFVEDKLNAAQQKILGKLKKE
eukprot:TRINITY_DN2819_c0_g1_i1.p1 TRINITY_DN2819_c0_g1~~TRINITY_DN2819_c0_g1_i1.p1  ORF type:complete len:233 (-),score=39.94 TRINITY_DN2819_c0_g1_i1:58-720(-)